MKNAETINQEESDTTLRVVDDTVVIENLTIKNKNLSNLLKEKRNFEDRRNLFINIIEQGVKLFTSLNGTLEVDWAKESLKTAEKDLERKFSDFEKHLSTNIKAINKDNIKDLESQKDEFLNKIDTEFNSFLNKDNKKSAIHLINEALSISGEELVKTIDETNNDQTKNVVSQLDEKLDAMKKDVLNFMLSINEKLDIEKGINETIDKTTLKGTPHEDYVQKALSSISLSNGDFVERTAATKGSKGNKGDHKVTLSENVSDSETLNVVFESKTQEYKTLTGIKKYLKESMSNRDALVGIMVFDKIERYKKITDLPFLVIDSNKAICIITKDEDGDLPLKLAYSWARAQAKSINQKMSSKETIDINQLDSLVKEAMDNLKMTQSIKKNHETAIVQIEKATDTVNRFRSDFKKNLDLITDLFVEKK